MKLKLYISSLDVLITIDKRVLDYFDQQEHYFEYNIILFSSAFYIAYSF